MNVSVSAASLALLACAAPVGAQPLPTERPDSTAAATLAPERGPGLLPSVVGGSLATGGMVVGYVSGAYAGSSAAGSWGGFFAGALGGAFLGSYAGAGLVKGLNGGRGSALGAAVLSMGAAGLVLEHGHKHGISEEALAWRVLGATAAAGALGFHIGPGSRGPQRSQRVALVPVAMPDGQGVYAVVRF